MDLEEERTAEAQSFSAKERSPTEQKRHCQCASSTSTHMGSRDGGFEGPIARRRAGCSSPGYRVQVASNHAQHIVDRHSFDANPCVEGSRRWDVRRNMDLQEAFSVGSGPEGVTHMMTLTGSGGGAKLT